MRRVLSIVLGFVAFSVWVFGLTYGYALAAHLCQRSDELDRTASPLEAAPWAAAGLISCAAWIAWILGGFVLLARSIKLSAWIRGLWDRDIELWRTDGDQR